MTSGARCPKCLGRSFTLSVVQSMETGRLWECDACGYDGTEEALKDNTPPGCIAVAQNVCLGKNNGTNNIV